MNYTVEARAVGVGSGNLSLELGRFKVRALAYPIVTFLQGYQHNYIYINVKLMTYPFADSFGFFIEDQRIDQW